LRYPLESRYAPLVNPKDAGPYDAIVVLTSAAIPAGGLAPFPTVDEHMFRRLDETWRLYRIQPKPIVVSGGHVNPFTPARDENKIARDYLIRWGVPQHHVLGEAKSRDTFESAIESGKVLKQKGWNRHLLVTSAVHMPRSMLVFPEAIPAPCDFTLGEWKLSPLNFAPTVSAGRAIALTLHEYIGLANYYWRISFPQDRPM
ncbi:MAG: YdcF family protein, partial [Candidatus Binatia bacterium]